MRLSLLVHVVFFVREYQARSTPRDLVSICGEAGLWWLLQVPRCLCFSSHHLHVGHVFKDWAGQAQLLWMVSGVLPQQYTAWPLWLGDDAVAVSQLTPL